MLSKLKTKLTLKTANAGCAPDSFTQTRCSGGREQKRRCTYTISCGYTCGSWQDTGYSC